jgi:uncharacterized membrane protein
MSRKNKQEQKAVATREAAAAQQQRQMTRQEFTASFSGPLPPPEMLKRYDDVLSGGAERIVRMVEKQSDHRMSLETRVVSADIKRANWGLVTAFIVALAGLGVTVFLAAIGEAVVGGAVGAADFGSVVGVFIYGTSSRRGEREQRNKRLTGR